MAAARVILCLSSRWFYEMGGGGRKKLHVRGGGADNSTWRSGGGWLKFQRS